MYDTVIDAEQEQQHGNSPFVVMSSTREGGGDHQTDTLTDKQASHNTKTISDN